MGSAFLQLHFGKCPARSQAEFLPVSAARAPEGRFGVRWLASLWRALVSFRSAYAFFVPTIRSICLM